MIAGKRAGGLRAQIAEAQARRAESRRSDDRALLVAGALLWFIGFNAAIVVVLSAVVG